MKKFLSLILAITIVASFAACTKKNDDKQTQSDSVQTDKVTDSEFESAIDSSADEIPEDENEEDTKPEDKTETQAKPESKPATTPQSKPETKPTTESKPTTTPESKPETTPEVKPESKPETKPEAESKPESKPEAKPESSPKTVGNILLADFKSKASSMSVQALADSLLTNPIIPFGGASMPVEPGFLSGFDNTEIKGFSEGYMFAPMIGSIPFIGYIFTLDAGTDPSSFVSNLKANANKRWNICTEADEIVAGNVGNKVFFVMCPTAFEE